MPSPSDVFPNSEGKGHADRDRRVVAHAADRHGLITLAALRAFGIGPKAVEYRVKAGRLFPVHRGVYVVGRPDLTLEGRFLAAVLAVGETATLTALSATVHWAFLSAEHAEGRPVDISCKRQRRPRTGITIHRTHVEWTRHKGIRVATAAHALATLSAAVNATTLQRAINEALVQRRVSLSQLEAQTDRNPALRQALHRRPSPTRSHLEDRALAYLLHHGFSQPETNVRIEGFEVDMLYREHRLIIEVDGARFHDTPLARERDRIKQAQLEAAGYRVLRVGWEDTDIANNLTAKRVAAALTTRPPTPSTRPASGTRARSTRRAARPARAPSPAR